MMAGWTDGSGREFFFFACVLQFLSCWVDGWVSMAGRLSIGFDLSSNLQYLLSSVLSLCPCFSCVRLLRRGLVDGWMDG